jgi:hypothetical protein
MTRCCMRSLTSACLVMISIAGCASSSVTLHPSSAMIRIGGADGAPVPPKAGSYRLEMVRNEREGFQFAVLPTAGAVAPCIRVRPESPDAPEVRFYQVLPVNHVAPPTKSDFLVPPRRLGQIPDVLMPLKDGQGVKVTDTQPGEIPLTVYVEFHTTAKTQPGRYRYTAWVGAMVHDELRIVVDVHEPVLPDRLPFRTATTWNWSLDDYFGRPLKPEEKQAFWNFFLDQRLSPTAFFARTPDPSPTEAIALKDRGLSVMNLTFVGGKHPKPLTQQAKDKLGPQLRQWREELDKAGMLDVAVVLLADEPEADAAPVCRENARWFKEQFPEVKIWVATRPDPAWDFADIFDPVTAFSTDFYKAHNHTDETFQWWRKTHPKGEYWWFHSVEPYGPYPNIRLDNLPIEARVSGWQNALYGVDGYEYFWMTDWKDNKDSRDIPWPQRAARWKTGMSGAGTLCYPDENGHPMPSLRLVNLRDGLEDWALVEKLAARSDRAARQALVGKVTSGLSQYSTDPQILLAARGRLIRMLDRTSRK